MDAITPHNIPADSFYICGHDKRTDNMENTQFEAIEKLLKEKDLNVVNPKGLDFKERCSLLAMCDNVITLPNWDLFQNSKNEVLIARAMGKQIVLADRIEMWFKSRKKQEVPDTDNKGDAISTEG